MTQSDKKPKRKTKKDQPVAEDFNAIRDELAKEEPSQEVELDESMLQDIDPEPADDLIESRIDQQVPSPSSNSERGTKQLSDLEFEQEIVEDITSSKANLESEVNQSELSTASEEETSSQEPMSDPIEALRAETLQPEYNEKPTVPRDAFFAQVNEDDILDEINKRNKTLPLNDTSTEDFIKDIKSSLENDAQYESAAKQEQVSAEDSLTSLDESSDYVADIENEIENASQATNPFETSADNKSENDFLTRLKEIFPEDYQNDAITKPLDDFDELSDSETALSSESWQEVIKSTEENENDSASSAFLLEQPDQINEDTLFEDDWLKNPQGFSPGSLPPLEDSDFDFQPPAVEKQNDEEEDGEEQKEPLDNLRRSFIEEFEQTPWQEEEIPEPKEENWIRQKFHAFQVWIRSLNTAEKVLLLMSSIITLAVILAIGLVLIKWQNSAISNATPPEAIQSVDPNLVYPTGLQLPGGWFFFLQRGELQNNKWNPQTAEWLANSTVRRVIAIPWSRQAEAVTQTLSSGDEIRVFMNNNDIMSYQVDEVKQVPRDDVEILSANEPSLVVILFKSDNSDRWVIFATP